VFYPGPRSPRKPRLNRVKGLSLNDPVVFLKNKCGVRIKRGKA